MVLHTVLQLGWQKKKWRQQQHQAVWAFALYSLVHDGAWWLAEERKRRAGDEEEEARRVTCAEEPPLAAPPSMCPSLPVSDDG